MEFAWNAIEGATGYRIVYRQSTDNENTTIEVDPNTTSYALKNLDPGATFYVNIQALGDCVTTKNSSQSKYKTLTTKPLKVLAQPEVKTWASDTISMEFAWNAIEGATGYRIVYRQSTDKENTTIEVDSNTTSYALESLDPSSTFYVNIQALGDGVTTKNSAQTKYKTLTTKPLRVLAQPEVRTWSSDTISMEFAWNAIDDATGYRIYYRQSTDKESSAIDVDPNTTSYSFDNLAPCATFYVNIVALGDGVVTKDSARVKYKTLVTKPLQTLAQPKITSLRTTHKTMTLAWNAVANADSYAVYYKTYGAASEERALVDAHTNSYTITGLSPDTKYYVRIVAQGDKVRTADSKSSATSLAATTLAPQLAAPTNVKATTTAFTIAITWKAVNNATGYEIVYNMVGCKSITVKVGANQTSYDIENVRPSKSYSVTIKALGDGGDDYSDSDYSVAKTFTTKTYVPSGSDQVARGAEIDESSAIAAIPNSYKKAAKNQGKVEQFNYTVGTAQKSACVYLPYGYSEQNRYDVVYLMHGNGQKASDLFGAPGTSTEFKNALDHLISVGLMKPIILVAATFSGSSILNGGKEGAFENVEAFTNELAEYLVPQLESKYSTYAETTDPLGLANSREHRAYGGFSMGAVSTWDVLSNELAYFSTFIPVSADLTASHWITTRPYNLTTNEMVSTLAGAVKKQGYTNADFIVYAFTGDCDYAYATQTRMMNLMKTGTTVFGKNIYYRVKKGATHTIPAFQEYLFNAFQDLYSR